MRTGIISPIKFLDKYCITDVQYCLPSLLVNSEPYWKFYKEKKKKGDIIILDCKKVSWRREPEDFRTIKLALGLLKPDIVIAPSHMFNNKDTLEVYKEFIEEFSSLSHITVGCMEGTSEEFLYSYPKRKTFAVPSHMYKYIGDVKLGPNTIYIENHLCLNELDGRKGILVTSLPIRLGLQGRLLSDWKPSPNSLTLFEEEDNYPKIIAKNVQDTIEYYKE